MELGRGRLKDARPRDHLSRSPPDVCHIGYFKISKQASPTQSPEVPPALLPHWAPRQVGLNAQVLFSEPVGVQGMKLLDSKARCFGGSPLRIKF